jgi:hypothetical protein
VVADDGRRNNRMPLDQARLRPHLRSGPAVVLRLNGGPQEAVAADAEAESPRTTSARTWKVPTGDELVRLRGLPMHVRGVRGAQRGTQPESALLAKEQQREQRRR